MARLYTQIKKAARRHRSPGPCERAQQNSAWPTPLSGHGPKRCLCCSRTRRLKFAVSGEAVPDATRVIQIVFIPGTRPELLSIGPPKRAKKRLIVGLPFTQANTSRQFTHICPRSQYPPKSSGDCHTRCCPAKRSAQHAQTAMGRKAGCRSGASVSRHRNGGQDRFGEARGSPPRLIAIITACVSITHPKLTGPIRSKPGSLLQPPRRLLMRCAIGYRPHHRVARFLKRRWRPRRAVAAFFLPDHGTHQQRFSGAVRGSWFSAGCKMPQKSGREVSNECLPGRRAWASAAWTIQA